MQRERHHPHQDQRFGDAPEVQVQPQKNRRQRDRDTSFIFSMAR
jgi:hypothetical protein